MSPGGDDVYNAILREHRVRAGYTRSWMPLTQHRSFFCHFDLNPSGKYIPV